MSLKLNLNIAKTQLLARKKQSVIAMLGVTFGIAMFIVMISFMKGVNQFSQETLMSNIPDIHIYNDISTDYSQSIAGEFLNYKNYLIKVHHQKPKQINLNLRNSESIINDLKRNSNISVISPLLSTQVFYSSGPVQINGLLNGVQILEESKLFNLKEKIISGELENLLTTDKGIIIGSGLAKKLNVSTGDLVSLTSTIGTSMKLRVVAIFQTGLAAVDNIKSYVNLVTVQQLLGKEKNYITDINLKLRNIDIAKSEAESYSKKYNCKADDWIAANASIETSNMIRDILTFVVSATLLIVAGFGIYNIMNIVISNKIKDIAILKAQGFERKDILQIFLSQSVIIGLSGAITGISLGFILSFGLSTVEFPKNDYVVLKYFPVLFEIKYYTFGVMFGIFTTFFAGLMPSIKASKVDPVAILRG